MAALSISTDLRNFVIVLGSELKSYVARLANTGVDRSRAHSRGVLSRREIPGGQWRAVRRTDGSR